jgi:hypothetical protein
VVETMMILCAEQFIVNQMQIIQYVIMAEMQYQVLQIKRLINIYLTHINFNIEIKDGVR